MSSMWTSSMNSTWGPHRACRTHQPGLPSSWLPRLELPAWPCPILTPGIISALPSSRHSATLALICSRTSDLISPVSPEGGRGAQGVSERRWGSRAGGWVKTEEDETPGPQEERSRPEGQGSRRTWEPEASREKRDRDREPRGRGQGQGCAHIRPEKGSRRATEREDEPHAQTEQKTAPRDGGRREKPWSCVGPHWEAGRACRTRRLT